MPSDMSRRTLLGAIGTAAVGASAGCLDAISTDLGSGETLTLPSVVTEGDLPAGSVPLVPEGRVVFVNFFATWCSACQQEMPVLRKLRAEYDAADLHMVSVTSQADDDLIRAFWDEYDATWPVVRDPDLEATTKYDVTSYPTNLLFDQEGEPATDDGPAVAAQSVDTLSWMIDPLLE